CVLTLQRLAEPQWKRLTPLFRVKSLSLKILIIQYHAWKRVKLKNRAFYGRTAKHQAVRSCPIGIRWNTDCGSLMVIRLSTPMDASFMNRRVHRGTSILIV